MKKVRWGVFLSLFIGFFFLSCNTIFDDLSECPQGVRLTFYHKNPCCTEVTPLYHLKDLNLLCFDAEGVLVEEYYYPAYSWKEGEGLQLPLLPGVYSFIAWSGVDEQFKKNQIQAGVTKKSDLLFQLKSNGEAYTSLANSFLWMGGSSPVQVASDKEQGSIFKEARVELQEQINHIRIVVESDENQPINLRDVEVIVRSANGSLTVDGDLWNKQEQLKYPGEVVLEENKQTNDFYLLGLKSGYKNELIVREKQSGKEIYRGDLLGSLLLKGDNINLACERSFEVKMKLEDRCQECTTYQCSQIWVNDWLIYSYDTNLGTNY